MPTLYVNAQPHALTVSEDLRATYVFDREGRPVSCFLEGRNYRFGLSGAVLLKVAAPGVARQRRLLSAEEGERIREAVRAWAAGAASALARALPEEDHPWIAAILAWDAERAAASRRAFAAAYKPISIVPPDQYRAVVLQATEGCSWNRCSFCSFYRDRRFRVSSPEAFREHIRRVKALLGRGLGLRRSIFLGDANALVAPQPRLVELLEVLHEEFPAADAGGPQGLYAFLDIFGAEQKTTAQYADLAARGLRRIYLGLESGDEAVFGLLNKPGSPHDCVTAVARIKAAGVQVGVILLAGAGGERLAAQHVAGSLAALGAMGLDAGDLVYISPLIVPADSPYLCQARDLGSAPLSDEALEAQLAALRAGARAATGGRPRVALYHIEEWIY